MKKVLLEKKELDTIKEIQQIELNLVNQLGNLEYQIQTLQLQKNDLNTEIVAMG